jgi:RNA polymerase-binding transcription factor DksA
MRARPHRAVGGPGRRRRLRADGAIYAAPATTSVRNRSVQPRLTPGDLEAFHHKLLARETQLRRAAGAADTNVNSAQLERNLHELREIDAALERINGGTYGFCLRCGKPLDRARLELFPDTRFDLGCMENEEIEHEEQHTTVERPVIGKPRGASPP